MSRILSVFEHERIGIGSDRHQLRPVEVDALHRLTLTMQPCPVEFGRSWVKFSRYCGVLHMAGTTLEVLPKVATDHTGDEQCRKLLVTMLRLSGFVGVRQFQQGMLGSNASNLLDIFIEEFCDLLALELERGAIARYETASEELSMVTGQIDFSRQLRENLFKPHQVHCLFDDFSSDNRYSQALLYVVTHLSRLTQSSAVRRKLLEVQSHLGAVSWREVTADDISRLSFDRTNARWQPIFQRCEQFLRAMYPNVCAGKTPALALLFDMSGVFERLLVRLVKRHQFPDVLIQHGGPAEHFTQEAKFKLKPDISFVQGDQVVAIADAKWKRMFHLGKPRAASQADIYQLAAYAQHYRCERVALVYPAMTGWEEGIRSVYTLATSKVQLSLLAIDLQSLVSDSAHEGVMREWFLAINGSRKEVAIRRKA